MHHEGNYELLPVHRRADLEEHTEQKKSLVTARDLIWFVGQWQWFTFSFFCSSLCIFQE